MSDITGPIAPPPAELLMPSSEQLRHKLRAAGSADASSREAGLREAAREFESLFVHYLLKVMRETIEESGLLEGGLGRGIYADLFDQELSRRIAAHGALNIAEILVKRLAFESSEPAGGGAAVPPITGGQSPGAGVGIREDGEEIPDFRLPVQAPISSRFGMRKHPLSRQVRFHRGVDIAAPEGTEVRAAWGGRVVFAGFQKGYGNTVVVEHPEGFQTRYAHLASVEVRTSDPVGPEHVLGLVGRTGSTTGPHLHFEVTRYGEAVDPAKAMAESRNGVPLGSDAGGDGS